MRVLVMMREAMARGRARDDWNASMLVGAEMDKRSESAKAFLLKDGMLNAGIVWFGLCWVVLVGVGVI